MKIYPHIKGNYEIYLDGNLVKGEGDQATIISNDGGVSLCSTRTTYDYQNENAQTYYTYETASGKSNYIWTLDRSDGFYNYTNFSNNSNWTEPNEYKIKAIIDGSRVESAASPYYVNHNVVVSYTENGITKTDTRVVAIKQIPKGVIYTSSTSFHVGTQYDFYFKTYASGAAPTPNFNFIQWETTNWSIVSGGGTAHVVLTPMATGVVFIALRGKYTNPNCLGVIDLWGGNVT